MQCSVSVVCVVVLDMVLVRCGGVVPWANQTDLTDAAGAPGVTGNPAAYVMPWDNISVAIFTASMVIFPTGGDGPV
jgi:hypothetical protein